MVWAILFLCLLALSIGFAIGVFYEKICVVHKKDEVTEQKLYEKSRAEKQIEKDIQKFIVDFNGNEDKK